MSNIRVITLDLWQTLIIDRPELGRNRMEYRIKSTVDALREAEENFTEEQITNGYISCYYECRDIREKGKDISFSDQIRLFIRCVDKGLLNRINKDTFVKIEVKYANSFYESPPKLIGGVKEMLATLKDHGYSLGLISNTAMTPGSIFRSYMESLGILHYFDHLTFSDEVLLSKPSPDIFFYSLGQLGSSPDEAVHVGDHLLLDVWGAQRVGMKTVWVGNAENKSEEIVSDATILSVTDLPQVLDSLGNPTCLAN